MPFPFKEFCPIHEAIEDPEQWVCRHNQECPITECRFCENEQEGTYEDKMKYVEFVRDLVMMFNEPGSRATYHPIIPGLDESIWEET